jgi:transposase-like protein
MRARAVPFRPPHCPNPICVSHRDSRGWRPRRHGFYRRRCAPRSIQRYRCSRCSRTFSSQTFSPTYWLRHPALLAAVYEGLVACAAFRQIARRHGVSPSTVQTHALRLGRHALLFLADHRPPSPPREPLVIDGFESFEHSQYYPFHANLAVGTESHFLYAFTDAELRRKGRMTLRQKRRRAALERLHGRPDPKAIEHEVAALLRLVCGPGTSVEIRSDEHRAYPRAFRRVEGVAVRHLVTPSVRARTTGNPLFPVNRMDLLLRHGGANHKRETIAFSKRRQSAMERLAVFAVWVNFQKSRSEKRRDETPAQVLGLAARKLTTAEVLSRRRFATRVALPPRWRLYYERRIPTRARRCAAPPRRHFAG